MQAVPRAERLPLRHHQDVVGRRAQPGDERPSHPVEVDVGPPPQDHERRALIGAPDPHVGGVVEIGRAIRLRRRHERGVRRGAGRGRPQLDGIGRERREGAHPRDRVELARPDPVLSRRLVQPLRRHPGEAHAEPGAAREGAHEKVVLRGEGDGQHESDEGGAPGARPDVGCGRAHREEEERERRHDPGRLIGGADPGKSRHRRGERNGRARAAARGASQPDRGPGDEHGRRQRVEEPALVDEPGGGERLDEGHGQGGAPRRSRAPRAVRRFPRSPGSRKRGTRPRTPRVLEPLEPTSGRSRGRG